MPTNHAIDYIELPASDLDAIEAFYATTFGWTFVPYGDDYRAFNDGRLDGGFHRADVRSGPEDGAALAVIFADDLETTRDTVVANGGRVCREIFSFPGGRRFHFLDPHGNELAVWSNE